MCNAFSLDSRSYDPLWFLPSMATTSTPNFSTSDCTHRRKHCSNSLGLIFSNTLLKVSGLGIPSGSSRNVSSHSFLLIPYSWISSQQERACYYCQNSYGDDIGEWMPSCPFHSWVFYLCEVFLELTGNVFAVYAGCKRCFGLALLLKSRWHYFELVARWIKSYTSSDSATLFPTILLSGQIHLSIGFETR